jgi:AhpD family alkylhydroperoxidase
MGTRMANAAGLLPSAMDGIANMVKALGESGLPAATRELVGIRVSQINGCAACLHGHLQIAKKYGETDERLATVAAWYDTPFFTDAERAALALAETMTRIADHSGEAVPDEVWDEAERHHDEKQLAGLVLNVALVNFFNRINTAVGEVAGQQSWA